MSSTKNRSSANRDLDEMYLEKGKSADAIHEFYHLCGLSDRYHIIQLRADNVIFAELPMQHKFQVNDGQISGDVPAWWSVNMELPEKTDEEYYANSFSNPMSDGKGKLTTMQIDIIMNSKVEEKREVYVFYFAAANYFTSLKDFRSIGIRADGSVFANGVINLGNTTSPKLGFAGYGNPRTEKGTFPFAQAKGARGVHRGVKIDNANALLQPFEPLR